MRRVLRSSFWLAIVGICATCFVSTSNAAPPADGELDPSFAGTGLVQLTLGGAFSSTDAAMAVVVQPDGKTVVAGSRQIVNSDMAVVRFNVDGTLDSSFDGDGIVLIPISANHEAANAVALQPDGKIVVAGYTNIPTPFHKQMTAVRLNSDGSLDTGFGSNGVVIIDAGLFGEDQAYGVAVRDDGTIMVVGGSSTYGFFIVVRLTSGGGIDASFGGDGVVTTPIGTDGISTAFGVAAMDDGRVMVVGSNRIPNAGNQVAVARYRTNGTLDPSLDGDGILYSPSNIYVPYEGVGMALLANDQFALAYSHAVLGNTTFLVTRHDSSGTLDSSFDGDGIAEASLSTGTHFVRGLAAQSDGKLLVVGEANPYANYGDLTVARFTQTGALDMSFGTNGSFSAPVDGFSSGLAVTTTPDGRIVAVGQVQLPADMLIVRLGGSDAPPPSTTTTSTTTTSTTTTRPSTASTTTFTPTSTTTTTTTTTRPPNAEPPVPAGASKFVPRESVRLLDTRVGIGAPALPLGAAESLDLSITGRESIPADATAVVVNVTITQADAPGYVSVWPTGSPQQVSNLNIDRAGGTIANLATVKLGTDGKVTLFTETGGHLIADLVGYYLPVATATSDGRFVALDPARVLDTRISLGSAEVTTVPNSTVRVHVLGAEGVPTTGVRAVVAVVTATGAEPGFVTAWSGHGARPLASSLNVDRSGQTRSNQIIVPVDDDGSISLFTEAGTQLIVDVAGYITDANAAPTTDGLFVPLDPFRALDTRSALGGALGPLPAGRVASIVVDVPQSARAIVGNVTATQALAPGFVTIYPKTTGPVPNVSNLNLDEADQTRAVHAMVKLGSGRGISLFTERGAQLLADVGGYYL